MRARGIKPGIFKNEALAEAAPPWGRLLFMGLWGLADREGRLPDRPGQIAIEIFPYDLANARLTVLQVEEMLTELAKGDDPFILRYEIGGRKIIQVINFKKHQSPHHTEKASELPEYQGVKKNKRSKKLTVDPPKSNGEPIVDPPKDFRGNRPDSLTPDSGHLTPDSQTPDSLNKDTPISPAPPAVISAKPEPKPNRKRPLPDDFQISEQVWDWAVGKGFDRLEEHLEAFKDSARANGYLYVDWDAAFKKAVRDDWAKLRQGGKAHEKAVGRTQNNIAVLTEFVRRGQGHDE